MNTPPPALTAVRPELPADVNEVLAKGMAKDPAGRYESCTAFALALEEALGVELGALRPARSALDADPVSVPDALIPLQQGDEGITRPSQSEDGRGTRHCRPAPPARSPRLGVTGPLPANPRRNTGLLVGGGAAAAILLVAGVIVGVTLSGQRSRTGGAAPAASTSSASAATSPPAGRSTWGPRRSWASSPRPAAR